MPRSKPIPPEVLHRVRNKDLESIQRLGRLLDARNTTSEIVEIVFSCLASYPVPIISTPTSKYILKTVVGARPSACLIALWKIIAAREELSGDIKTAIIERLRESGDSVFGWARLCLQNELPCVPDDMVKRTPSVRIQGYLFQARMVHNIIRLDSGTPDTDFARLMLSSSSLIDLLLELWVAEDHRDRASTLVYRIVEVDSPFGCAIVDLVCKVISNDHSREVLLRRCSRASQRTEFCFAFTDRVTRGWERGSVPVLGWVKSLSDLTSISVTLHHTSIPFRHNLRRIGFLMQMSIELGCAVDGVVDNSEMHFLTFQLIPALKSLAQAASQDTTPSRIRDNWTSLASGSFVDAVFRSSSVLDSSGRRKDLEKNTLEIIGEVGRYMTYPRIFGDCQFDISIDKVSHYATIAQGWVKLLYAHSRSCMALQALKSRPLVYLCDYLPCALSGKELEVTRDAPRSYIALQNAKNETGTSIIVTNVHMPERFTMPTERRSSRTWYSNALRADQAAFLEATYIDKAGDYERDTPYPVFDNRSLHAGDTVSDVGSTSPQRYIEPRLECLAQAYYNLGSIPTGWRLSAGLFPPIGDETVIRLISLLKPVESGFRTVYCVSQYMYNS